MKYWCITLHKGKTTEIEEGFTFEQMNRKLKKDFGITIEYIESEVKSNL